MSRNQVILLFLLSIVFGLGAVFFAKQWMDRQVQPQTEVEVVERVPVVVASREIPVGTVIEEQHLATRLLEKSWVEDNQFSSTEGVVGKIAGSDMYTNEIIVAQRLTTPGEGATLAALIPEDKRAVTIRVNDVIGVAGFLLPGNKVDVLSTVQYSKTSANTTTILKDIRVLAVDQTAKTQENKPIIVRAVTLEVSPREAEKLLSAKSKGDIQLVLRNPHAVEEKVVKYVPPPSVTIIKGTDSSNIRVKN
ncbi:Flp pilus assembly protein CpaB [Vibrio fluvialis]|uniref:Flp pilus assembly protein CpaB n=1 Tax=Vibrio fluvialis TaxID=676 RepID=A0AAX2LTB1_VIBFL|nr:MULTISPECIES: Flp pilus assembly protein CpaB [Vibrio]HDM8035446.1 Flp pilus assembly protein CpaB [Vibrio fluvialis clinical-1]AMF95228.1 Flp pilus assembly protein CpaB [Vibrio fluvialis]AVH31190.1 Flp pilus assembly protein CpaB [Vibrio fluvialis]EKO3370924.1 Flp pilus assembly protein CpaB [Vibrio fluvialis]EKO3377006.1 Flp pilus assembly protein CpaB [Vibrio fluvialis]